MISILVADDNPTIREIVCEYLRLFPEEFTVVGEAGNGEQAVALAARLRPDIALLDVRMPVMDGIAATAELLRHHPTCRVITYTSFVFDELEALARAAGARAHLHKPFELDELHRSLRAVAAMPAGPAARLA